MGGNAAIISENNLLERDLQDSLKDFERGKLGVFLSDLEKRNPGLLILNKHPNDLYHFNISKSEPEEDVPVIIYIPFEILERSYTSGNALISDIVAFSKNQDDTLIRKTSEYGCIKDSISRLVLKKKQARIITINYTKDKKSEKVARCINCEKIIYLNEYEEKARCIYCGYLNPVQKAIDNRFSVSSVNQDIECMCGYTIKNAGIYGQRVVCPYCGVELHVKGMPIKVQGRNHREVLEVANELLNKSFTLFNKERKNDMEKILIISALEKELEPILEMIDSPLKPQNTEEIDGRKYFIYEVSSTLTVICTSFLGMGQINAALAVKDAVNYYGVSKVILTGICGGIDREMKYGDIIISDQIVDYELAKIKSDDLQVRWNVYRSDFDLVQSMRMFKSDRWSSYLKRLFPDPKYKKPNVYSGIVLSGNKVIANNEEIKRFTKTWAKALAVEMEASGIAAALYQMKNAPSFVMVKAICDFADSEKSDDWQEYAAYAAAIFVLN